MLDFFSIFLSIVLILIIFLRSPKDSAGLTNFTTSNNLLNSSVSGDSFLNYLILTGVILYIGIAIKLNLLNNVG